MKPENVCSAFTKLDWMKQGILVFSFFSI